MNQVLDKIENINVFIVIDNKQDHIENSESYRLKM